MKFKKVEYVELQMTGAEFDSLMGLLEVISQKRVDYPMRIQDFQKEAHSLEQKIKVSMIQAEKLE